MNQKQLLPPGKRGETGKQSLLKPVRQLLTKKVLAAMVIVAVIGSIFLIQQIPQALAAQVYRTPKDGIVGARGPGHSSYPVQTSDSPQLLHNLWQHCPSQ